VQYDATQLAQAQDQFRDMAQSRLDEPVEAAWLFHRAGFLPSYGVSKLSPLAGTIMSTINKKRASGFPTQFLLALTPTKVYAYGMKFKGRTREYTLKDELAVWDRGGLQVDWKESTLHMTVTIESPGEGEKVVCGTGKDAASMDFLERLRQPVASA
jgi:hypothetical protein